MGSKMKTLLWDDQFKAYKPGMTRLQAIEEMNKLVEPCAEKPKLLGFIPRRHHIFEDYTWAMNTFTYDILDRCRDCGLLRLRSGL